IITATVFTSRGQEAISVGSAYALGPNDFVSPITRNIGAMLVRGVRPRDIFTQYMGKATRMVQKLKSCGLTIVIVEHSAEPLVPSYSAVRRDRLHWNNETIVAPLMVTLQMIMRHKLANRIPQRVFTKEDHLPQAILPNRSDEPFRISIRIRRLRRQFDGLDSDRGKRSEKLPRVKRISIVDQIARFSVSRR